MQNDLTLKEIEIITGKLIAIYRKLDDENEGAIKKLGTILEKIDPMVIDFTGKKDYDSFKNEISKVETLLMRQQTVIEDVTSKYMLDAKELAEKIIGPALKEVLIQIEKEKTKDILSKSNTSEIEKLGKKLNLNYMILLSTASIFTAFGFLMGSLSLSF